MRHVFRGQVYRVQLTVYDLTGPEVTPTMREDKPAFNVVALKIDAHPSTAYGMAGKPLYHGNDFDAAWDYVKMYTGVRKPPAKFDRYWKGVPS